LGGGSAGAVLSPAVVGLSLDVDQIKHARTTGYDWPTIS
jgi:hypothetical protein